MRARRLLLATLVLIACAACATRGAQGGGDVDPGEGWRADWNGRIDASQGRNDHPCGDFVFDAWAENFLAGCELASSRACDRRLEWVWSRSRQCDEWQAYLLRNHFKHVRRDDIPEPDMHVN